MPIFKLYVYGFLKGVFVMNMPKLCVCGNAAEKEFRKVCNELLHEIWRDGGCFSGYDWKYAFNSRLCSEYGSYTANFRNGIQCGDRYGVFAHIEDIDMSMIRKVLREVGISV